MHVLYFHQHFSTPSGFTGTRSYENSRLLIERGHSVTMICGSFSSGATGLDIPFRRGKRRGDVDGIDIIELQLPYANKYGVLHRSLVFLKFAFRSIWIALTERCDVVFATSTPLTAAIPGIFARIFRWKPFVFEVRDLWPELPQAMGAITNPVVIALLRALERSAYWAADSCIGLSPGIVDGIKKTAGPDKHVALIPNGCDLELFSQKQPSADAVAGEGSGGFIAAFTGTHGMANGLDAVLDAAAELKRRNRSDISLMLIGDGQSKPELVKRANADGLTNIIFRDPMPKSELNELMLEVDAGLMILANVPAFYFGTSPNKFFDYIAQGLPVLNNYPGWLAEMIDAQKIGIVVPPDSPAEFADGLEYLADHPDVRADMGQKARRFAEQNFDRRDLSGQWVSEIERVAQQ